jgi:peptidase S8 and S53 subtilisin kexin sedolisin
VGGHAYWALVRDGAKLQGLWQGNCPTSLVAVKPEWKLAEELQHGKIPSHAQVGTAGVRVVIRYAPNATPTQVEAALAKLGLQKIQMAERFGRYTQSCPWRLPPKWQNSPIILSVGIVPPPLSLYNAEGRVLGRASLLNLPTPLGGRALEGEGVRIGIWDANITQHVDFGNRIHTQEYELADDHGTHVAGTVLGAGLVNPDARGMAPKA